MRAARHGWLIHNLVAAPLIPDLLQASQFICPERLARKSSKRLLLGTHATPIGYLMSRHCFKISWADLPVAQAPTSLQTSKIVLCFARDERFWLWPREQLKGAREISDTLRTTAPAVGVIVFLNHLVSRPTPGLLEESWFSAAEVERNNNSSQEDAVRSRFSIRLRTAMLRDEPHSSPLRSTE